MNTAGAKDSPPQLPLAGIRVLSLAEQYPGPLATMLLADLGADVILVERPGGGDPSRRYDGHFSALNRNKRSIELDLKSASGRDAFLRLAATADVLMEGFRPGVMARLGLGAEDLSSRFPDLVYVSISSFGQTGPLASMAGHDISIQAVAGLIDVPLGKESRDGLPVLPLADIASGMFAAFGTVCTLLGRSRGAKVAPLDVSMLDCLAFWMAPIVLPRVNGLTPAPFPPRDAGYGVFQTADRRQITLSIAGEDHLWRKLCSLLDLQDLNDLSERERVDQADRIDPRLRAAIVARDWDWLEKHFEADGIAFGPVLGVFEVADGEQVVARDLYFRMADTGERHVRQPVLFGGKADRPHRPAPNLGQHTTEILRELGISNA